MSNWQDVTEGRSAPTPKRGKGSEDLRSRSPVRPWMSAEEKRAVRQERIAQLTAETALCSWCGEPMWRADHSACPAPPAPEPL